MVTKILDKVDANSSGKDSSSNNKSGTTFHFTPNIPKNSECEKASQKKSKSKESEKQASPKNVIKEEESKYESELANEEKKESVNSVSSPSNSSSDSGSEFDINQASIPKIRISNFDDIREKLQRTSSKKANFDPKNFVIENKMRLEELYDFCGRLGKGTYGEVMKLKLKSTGEFRACKTFLKSRYNIDKLLIIRNEIMILKMMDHPNIVKIYEYYEDTERFNIIMEYCKGGELFENITKTGAFDDEVASNIMSQILSAISYLHSKNIIHSDLKAENIMFVNNDEDDLHIKLIDFGMASKYDPEKKLSHIQGTPYYIAPDVLRNCYDSKADIWSCGVLLFILLTGCPPFTAKSLKEIFQKILIGKVDFNDECCKDLSTDAENFIKQMLTYESSDRPTASECLKHPWIKKFDVKRKKNKALSTIALK